jgi:probable rRNA maturation factor
MVKNLTVACSKNIRLDKRKLHFLVGELKTLLKFEITSFEISFIPSEEIFAINSRYLKHFCTTDIITFNYSGENFNFDGEIFISIEDAKNNANKFGVTFDNEIMRLVIHGILHMLGYDDTTAVEKKKMKKIENELVHRFEKNIRKLVIK